MSEQENNIEFIKNLIAQDPPPLEEQSRHKETLLKMVKRRIWLGKMTGGATYIVLFSVAFWAFLRSDYTDNVVHSICWAALSLHILLWFLIYFLREIYRAMAEMAEKSFDKGIKGQWRNTDRFITIVAILVFAFANILLYRSFSLSDPLKASDVTAGVLWATVFFIFWYPFGTASLIGKLWLEYKKMELNINNSSDGSA